MAKRIPKYCLHKGTGQAFVKLNGQTFYLGQYGTPASRERYESTVARHLGGTIEIDRETVTVGRLAVLYVDYAEGYYRKNDRTTSEVSAIRSALRPLVKKYSREKVSHFGPRKLKDVRDVMIAAGWKRTGINAAVRRIVRMLRWATENELILPSVYESCRSVTGLRWGRSAARESAPVKPVDLQHVEAVKPFLSRQLAAMVDLQLATGMRPGEVVIMRMVDIDTGTPDAWQYRPHTHKTQHHGRARVVFL